MKAKKSILVGEDTWKRLILLRLQLGERSLDAVIKTLLDNYEKKKPKKVEVE